MFDENAGLEELKLAPNPGTALREPKNSDFEIPSGPPGTLGVMRLTSHEYRSEE